MNDRHQRLLQLIREQAGDNFRSAFRYNDEGWEALYVRSDLATSDLESIVPALARRVREREPLVREEDYARLGPQRASIELHADAALLHIREGERSGAVITLENDVARNLADFVSQCERVLQEEPER